MFYSHLVLTKKGPLGHVWLAAQLGEARIPKKFAATAKISLLCRTIEDPVAPFALRLSAHLMMGVTRVYSRKSTLILAEAKQLLSTLHHSRDKVSTTISTATGRKRRRVSGPTSKFGDSPARFEDITLPEPKRKRTRRGNQDIVPSDNNILLDIPGLVSAEGGLDQFGRSLGSISLDISFPSVQFGASETHSRAITTPFRARDEDITLAPGSDTALGSHDFSIELDGARSLSTPVIDLFDNNGNNSSLGASGGAASFNEGSVEFAAVFGRNTPRRSETGGTQVRSILDPVDPLHNGEMVIADPEPPLDFTGNTTSAKGSTAELTDPTSIQDVAQPLSTGRRSNRTSAETGITGVTGGTKRSKGILSDKLLYTETTELPQAEIRDWLADTTDIVLRPGAPRPYRRPKSNEGEEASMDDLLMQNNPLGIMGAEGSSLWADIMGAKIDVNNVVGGTAGGASSMETARSGGKSGSLAMKSPHLSGASGSAGAAGAGAADTGGGGAPLLGADMDMPMPVDNNEEDPLFFDPETLPPVHPGAGNIPVGDAKSLSLKTGDSSAGGGASGGISLASTGGSKGPERMRDQVLDITAADRAEFAKARRLSDGGFRLKGLTPSETQREHEGMPIDIPDVPIPGASGATEDDDGDLRTGNTGDGDGAGVPVGDSLRLEEQTEEATQVPGEGEGEGGTLAAIEQLNVRSFKVLQMLRDLHKSKQDNDEDDGMVVVVKEFARDMSRLAISRVFLDLLALTTAGFIRCDQTAAFGKIVIYTGKYF